MDGEHTRVAFAATHIGKSHEADGRVCQDSSRALTTPRYSLAIVSDGHGAAPYFRSDRGSALACEAVEQCTGRLFDEAEQTEHFWDSFNDAAVWQFLRHIVKTWNELVAQDIAERPFSEEELAVLPEKVRLFCEKGKNLQRAYGCTLCFLLVSEPFTLAARNGDGDIALLGQDGRFFDPVEWNEKCADNVTTSLCDADTIDEFRFALLRESPAAAFCATDGIANSYPEVEDLYRFYLAICRNALKDKTESIGEGVQAFLPVVTAHGSGDDVSLAGILQKDWLVVLAPLFAGEPAASAEPGAEDEKEADEAVPEDEGEAGGDTPEETDGEDAPDGEEDRESGTENECPAVSGGISGAVRKFTKRLRGKHKQDEPK